MILAAGCVANQERLTQLEDGLRVYDGAIRWGDYGTAQAFVKRGEAGDAAQRPLPGSNIRVTAYEVVREAMLRQEDSGYTERLVQLRYYNSENAVEKTLLDRQRWEFDEQAQRWLITSGLPPFQ